MTTNNTKHEEPDLKALLIEELKTAYRLLAMMDPKSEAEFIAVALPNLHTALHVHIRDNYKQKTLSQDNPGADYALSQFGINGSGKW